ncbi:hypothetical protein B0I31_10940 [Saccharothrix carnea]|uniref:Uncharacterized protein n=1 Tax=Saccharothrix carnea TaxID=1280637 RepID=A0A2P8I458_SACCR|nr:hypothetical protein [Saccharothrix carnea]PSL53250.1 hypothetical protein B0I31_10940 [Saccharothrix carnea]
MLSANDSFPHRPTAEGHAEVAFEPAEVAHEPLAVTPRLATLSSDPWPRRSAKQAMLISR